MPPIAGLSPLPNESGFPLHAGKNIRLESLKSLYILYFLALTLKLTLSHLNAGVFDLLLLMDLDNDYMIYGGMILAFVGELIAVWDYGTLLLLLLFTKPPIALTLRFSGMFSSVIVLLTKSFAC